MTIAIIGSGNIAAHFAKQLSAHHFDIKGLYARSHEAGKAICLQYQIPFIESIEAIVADVIFLCVKDDAIKDVATQLVADGSIIVHCSGSTEIDVIPHKRKGVFYPLQTFTSTTPSSFLEVPILISSSDDESLNILRSMAESFSKKVIVVDDEKRLAIHLAAVMVNNFTNHLAIKAKEILQDHQLDYDILQPLMITTFEKLTRPPYNFQQTGPAKRGDDQVLAKHMEMIQGDKALLAIYKAMSESIKHTESITTIKS